jgi:predicted homoserine dehydrogenase-like protein
MNLYRMLRDRAIAGEPIRVALIGAGKFGSMYFAQAKYTPGIHLIAVGDLSVPNAKAALVRVGWDAALINAKSIEVAAKTGKVFITDDVMALIQSPLIDVIIDATGSPAAGIAHVLACCEHGKDIIMVNVEADALAGPLLAKKADEAGITYSLAYGDQPALICDMVDWARTSGFEVIAAGKGTKYLPSYHQSTPDTVWGHYGLTPEAAKLGAMNPQMFNSFLDGTKSAIEMAAVANATGLLPADHGLQFPPCGVDDLARVLRPLADGGQLTHRGQVEVISSVERDGRPVFRDLRWGVYVTFEAPSDYAKRCFQEYGLVTDSTGRFSSMYKPFHLIGMELGISVASVAMRGEPTGVAQDWLGDVVATAKSDLKVGTVLDLRYTEN